MMTKVPNERLAGITLPGQNKNNPLLALLSGVTPQQVQEIQDEIEVTRAYLDKLEKLRDVLDFAPVAVVQHAGPPPAAIAALPPPPPPEPESEPAEVDDVEASGGLSRTKLPAEVFDAEEAEDEEAPAPKPAKPATPRGTSDNPQFKDLEPKRRAVAEFLLKKGYAQQRHIMQSVAGLGGRNIATVLNHAWFEKFTTGGEEVYRLTALGKREGVEL